jgi:hypothetical protein
MSAPTTATGPFLNLGFTKVDLPRNETNGRLGFHISGRPRGQVEQWITGEFDQAGRGVIIGTIELNERVNHRYAGAEQIGTGRGQVPEDVALLEWNTVVRKGGDRWAGIFGARPQDAAAPAALATAERRNGLIYGLVLLANQALNLGIGPGNPLRYVGHEHVASVDGGLTMVYGRHTRAWATQDMIYMVNDKSTEPLLALLGTSNANFVQFLIEQFGHRLGISRLESVTVCRMGLDIHWNFA